MPGIFTKLGGHVKNCRGLATFDAELHKMMRNSTTVCIDKRPVAGSIRRPIKRSINTESGASSCSTVVGMIPKKRIIMAYDNID